MSSNQGNPNLISDREIRISKWWLEHKLQIIKIGKISLIAITALIWVFFIIQVVIYFMHYEQNRKILADLGQQNISGNQTIKPTALKTNTVYVFEESTGNYDFLAQVENTNTKYTALSFTYHFELNGKSTPRQTSWLLPGEKKYLASLAFSTDIPTLSAGKLVIDDVTWQRLDDLADLPVTNFVIQDLKFSNISLSQGANVGSEITGRIFNESIYGFKEVRVTVVLFNNDTPVAVGSTLLNNFTTEEIKPLQFTWTSKFPFSATPQAFVEVDVLNYENLILP